MILRKIFKHEADTLVMFFKIGSKFVLTDKIGCFIINIIFNNSLQGCWFR